MASAILCVLLWIWLFLYADLFMFTRKYFRFILWSSHPQLGSLSLPVVYVTLNQTAGFCATFIARVRPGLYLTHLWQPHPLSEHPRCWTSLHMATVVSNVNRIQSIGVLRPTHSPRPAGPGWWMSTVVLRVLFGKWLLWQWQLICVLGIQSSHMSCRLRSTTTSGHCRYPVTPWVSRKSRKTKS